MKQKLLVYCISIILTSCSKKEKNYDHFEYSFAGTFSTVFSIKFTDNDTVFIREHWNGEINENGKFPKDKTNYFALLNTKQKDELSDLLQRINFQKLESEYYEDYNDGSAFQLIIRKGNSKKSVLVHSYAIPKELDSLSKWINYTKSNLQLTEINRELEFKSLERVLPPPPPAPIVN